MIRAAAFLAMMTLCVGTAAFGRPAFSCGGFALLGGAELVCSHTDPAAPTQICTYSWALMKAGGGQAVIEGTFLLTPGELNLAVYQGGGFAYALSSPIVLCQNGNRTP